MENPGLLNVVRQRMAEQSSDELLRIWVENDRFHWSAETFEAVRSVLAERGVELPPQNDPPPLAKKRDPLKDIDPVTAYWHGWLRPILMIGAFLAAAELPIGLWALWFHVAYFSTLPTPGEFWSGLASFSVLSLVATLLRSVCLLIGVVLSLRLRPAGRRFLLVYCFASFAWTVALLRDNFHTALADGTIETWYDQAAMGELYLYGLAYPLILLLFLRRREIKELFQTAAVAFEVQRIGKE